MGKYAEARRLGISASDYDALRWVRLQLETGAITFNEFNMCVVYQEQYEGIPLEYDRRDSACGSVGCIGGWMAIHIAGIRPDAKGHYHLTTGENHLATDYVQRQNDMDGPLKPLFYPNTDLPWGAITPAHAIKAIDQFLAHGDVDWEGIIGDE